MMSHAEARTKALWCADAVMLATLYVMQKYLTDVWGLSFTAAATLLNIWGGFHRILPIFFLFLADTLLGNFWTLVFSAIFSLTGHGLMTWIAGAGYRCLKKAKEAEECDGYKERTVFITAMFLLALGRAALFACTKPFIQEQSDDDDDDSGNGRSKRGWKAEISEIIATLSPTLSFLCFLFFFGVPGATFLLFPHAKKWYFLFGVSAFCSLFASLVYLGGVGEYKRPGHRAKGSPITDIVRVFVAAAFKRSIPSPDLDDHRLHLTAEGHEEFSKLTPARVLGFLHKAAIKPEDNNEDQVEGEAVGNDEKKKKKKSWSLSSVNEVESAKIMIRILLVYTTYFLTGAVSSIGDTYLVEQATHMNYNLGPWKPPLQLLQLIFLLFKLLMQKLSSSFPEEEFHEIDEGHYGDFSVGIFTTLWSITCCTAAAAIERRRVHSTRGRHVVDVDGRGRMGAFWLLFEVVLLGIVKAFMEHSLSILHKQEAPKSMERYHECLAEGVVGVGFMCGALSVYLVGIISHAGGGKGWFQGTLNESRLDRYYWVLACLTALNFFYLIIVNLNYRTKQTLIRGKPTEKPPTRKRRRRGNMWVHVLNRSH